MAVTLKGPTVKSAPLDVARIRKDFPILAQTVRGKPLVYLDNAATSQKPRQVIDAMSQVFEEHNANIHRGVYEFSERTTALFEEARAKVARFINAPSEREIIFVRNATEALNLVAYAWGRDNIKRGDRIVTTVPCLYGGDIMRRFTVRLTEWNELPWKFEAGTSSYGDASAPGAAVDYLSDVGVAKIHGHELSLVAYLLPRLQEVPGVTVYGPKDLESRVGVVSFNIEGIHPHDVATIFDREGVCVRAGHHCNQPLMTRLGVPATTRASMYLYNTTDEMDALVGAIHTAKKVFGI